MDAAKLSEPCPFCKSDFLSIRSNMDLDGMTFIVCEDCGAVVSFHERESKDKTIEAWNSRPKE